MKLLVLVLMLVGCTSSPKRTAADCEKIVRDIRLGATGAGRIGPDGQLGTADDAAQICGDPAYPQFKARCDDLTACNAEVDGD